MSTQFWTVSDELSVDTGALLRANATLRLCDYSLNESHNLLSRVVSGLAGFCPLGVEPFRVALALEAESVAEQTLIMVAAARERTRELINWRERAAQIYAQAESRAVSHGMACLDASIAKCGLVPPGTAYALPFYIAAMRGRYRGRGDEALHARYFVNAVSTIPFLNIFTTPYLLFSGRGRIPIIADMVATYGKALPWSKPGIYVNGPSTLAYVERGVVKWRVPAGGNLVTGPFTQAAPSPKTVETPTTMAGAIRGLDKSEAGGGIIILRHEGPRGRSWSVLIPGTKTWGLNGKSVQNLRTNLEEIAGKPSDQRYAVQTAMELAGVQNGEPVELVGHSQGGIVAGNLATDPAFTSKYSVVSVLSAGSPLSKIPKLHPNSLALENLTDIVPATGGGHNTGGTTVYFDPAVNTSGGREIGDAGPHSLETYEAAAREIDIGTDPNLVEAQRWTQERLVALKLGPETETTQFEFQTHRDTSKLVH